MSGGRGAQSATWRRGGNSSAGSFFCGALLVLAVWVVLDWEVSSLRSAAQLAMGVTTGSEVNDAAAAAVAGGDSPPPAPELGPAASGGWGAGASAPATGLLAKADLADADSDDVIIGGGGGGGFGGGMSLGRKAPLPVNAAAAAESSAEPAPPELPPAEPPPSKPQQAPPLGGGAGGGGGLRGAPPQSREKAPAAGYAVEVLAPQRECERQEAVLGQVQTVEECDELSVAEASCGEAFMFSPEHPDWKCRCCAEGEGGEGSPSPAWNVYRGVLPRASPAPAPPGASPSAASPEVLHQGQECGQQILELGDFKSPKECDWIAAHTEECGSSIAFMFSKEHPEWKCRCCTPDGVAGGKKSPPWSVYKIVSERPTSLAVPTLAPPRDPFKGLPIDEGRPKPDWLLREDELVIDARPRRGGGILIIMAVLMDSRSTWGKQAARPLWLRAILATVREHARRMGHAMILRASPTQPQLTKWQWRNCGMKRVDRCVVENERENFNWEKHLMLSEYLLNPEGFSHVLMLDADAALVHTSHNTLQKIADTLDEEGKDIFLTNEDWLDENGARTINGGLIFIKNTEFTRNVFQDTFEAHLKGSARLQNWRIGIDDMECSSNEQICLNDLWQGKGKDIFRPKAMMASGLMYNRGAERGGESHLGDDDVEVMHWMGGSKSSAGTALCENSFDYVGDLREYGCKG